MGPLGACRVGWDGKKYILNPKLEENQDQNLDLVVAGTKDGVLMVESEPLLFQNTLLFNLDPFQTSSYEQIMTIIEKLGVGKLNLFRDLNRQLNDVKTLSGGEKVILQVIRCLIREPKILVIDNVLDSLPATLKDGFIQGIIKYQQNSIFLVDQDNDLLEKVHAFALINGQVGRLRSKQE